MYVHEALPVHYRYRLTYNKLQLYGGTGSLACLLVRLLLESEGSWNEMKFDRRRIQHPRRRRHSTASQALHMRTRTGTLQDRVRSE